MNRRQFLVDSASLFGAGAMWPVAGSQRPDRPREGEILTTVKPIVRLGGPVFTDTADPVAFARAHRRLGYRAAYGPQKNVKDDATIRALADACGTEEVVIAEVGRWVNLLEADPAKRRANLETVTEGLALADALGALCCVDIAGSFNPDVWYGPHPDNLSERFFDAAVENARKIIDAVKPSRAKFCYEMMGWSIPDSPESFLRLLKAVDRPAFGVHLDPCNLVNAPARFYRNTDLLNECFDKLGQWIVSCHAKDLAWDVEMNVHFREVRPGAGSIDYETYLRRLSAMPQRPPLMLEHLPNAEEYDKGRNYLFDLGRKMDVDVGAPAD
jgi:sugar phosphate isomerase/epimerase